MLEEILFNQDSATLTRTKPLKMNKILWLTWINIIRNFDLDYFQRPVDRISCRIMQSPILNANMNTIANLNNDHGE